MALEKKSLPLRVLPCPHQDGKARYPDQEKVKAPYVAMYRNNLTALSQYRNLLFVACVDKIHVYTPSFPEQIITSKPDLIMTLARSRPGLTGYLDRSRPHAVNHLIVGDIGDEEVVVVACDDGDVISYFVRSISLAIDEKTETVLGEDFRDKPSLRPAPMGWTNMILPVVGPSKCLGCGCRTLAPWFHENVGASAWGLATHKHAMLLAVSSNVKDVHVFAPALASERHEAVPPTYPDPQKLERFTAWKNGSATTLKDRSIGRKVTLQGHAANIPNIAFCDNTLDLEGIYLASTDIDGHTIIWDIWRGARIIEHFEDQAAGPRGWGVACLDPRASRLSEGLVDTFGCACRVDEGSILIDNSRAGDSVENNSQWHPGFSALGPVPGNPSLSMVIPGVPALAAAATLPGQDFLDHDGGETEDEVDEEMHEIDDVDDAFDEDALDDEDDAQLAAFASESSANEPNPQAHIPHAIQHLTEAEQIVLNDVFVASAEFAGIPALAEGPPASEEDQQTLEATEEKPNPQSQPPALPFNLLQTSQRDIRLFRSLTRPPSSTPPSPPQSQVLCRQALHQKMPPGFTHFCETERLNMIFQIPDLGLVVIGNQIGRVGLLSLTRWEEKGRRKEGFRIEAILPLKGEEERGVRPRRALLGMAVGPVQGMMMMGEGKGNAGLGGGRMDRVVRGGRRWRVLLYYCDHTVLSYEVSRAEGEGEVLVL